MNEIEELRWAVEFYQAEVTATKAALARVAGRSGWLQKEYADILNGNLARLAAVQADLDSRERVYLAEQV